MSAPTWTSHDIFARLRALDIPLPERVQAQGGYALASVHGGIAYTSGQLPRLDSTGGIISGCLAAGDSLELAHQAARLCFARALLALHQELGDLARLERLLFLRGFVNARPDFAKHGAVMDAASDLAITLFGESGRHGRSALGVSSLPAGGLVEIELVAAVRGA
ncbi:MAG: hypothetical protein B7X76_01165 [Azorhizobium sp. 39-67-5]|jgi:enamine deaminase RidA (YjgF/YER057c/UK114 family)|nr:MAG: hypothetical protein B7X76_01165 [Azorhizobium sp. 39-67-5]